MSNTAAEWTEARTGRPSGSRKIATMIAEREAGDSLLRFLGRLAAFGLAAGRDPLLKPAKPGN